MDPSLFMPSSGYGPQPVGFNPTPADALGSDLRARSSDGFAKWALYNDPTFKRATGLLANGLAGDPATAKGLLHNSGTGQFIKDSVGIAMQAGVIPGGNPVQMATNVHQMIASSGFKVGGNVGGGGQLFGSGAITDQIAKTTYQQIQQQFFDPVTGLGKRAAHGMDKSQMGDALGYLTARGAFQGTAMHEVNNYSHKEVISQLAKAKKEGADPNFIKDLEGLAAGGKGGIAVKIDKNKMKKVTDMVTDYAATLKDAREIFGNLPIAELTQNAERLIGASLTEFGSTGEMRNKMANIKAVSAAYGLNAEAVASRMMGASDAIQNQMFQKASQDPNMSSGYEQAAAASAFAKFGAAAGERATTAGIYGGAESRSFARAQGEKGRYVREFNEQQQTQALSSDLAAVVDEKSSGMNTALSARAIMASGMLDTDTSNKINDLFTRLGNTGSEEGMKMINSQIQATLTGAGIDVGAWNRKSTAERTGMLSTADTQSMTDMLTNNVRARSTSSSIADIARTGRGAGMLGTSGNRKGFGKMMNTLNAEAMSAITEAINPDGSIDEAKLEEAYAKVPGLAESMSKGEVKDILSGMRDDPNRKKGDFKSQLQTAEVAFRGHIKNSGSVDDMTRMAADKRAAHAYLSKMSLGGPLDKEDFKTELMRGFLGAGKVSDEMIMAKARNDGGDKLLNLKMNSDKTGLDVAGDDIDKLGSKIGADKLASLYKDLGIRPGDTQALAKALGSPKGFMALQKNMGGALSGTGKDGFSILGQKDAEATGKDLEADASLEAARTLIGSDKDIKGLDLATEEGVAALHDKTREGLTADGSKRLLEIVEGGKASGFEGTDFKTLAQEYKKSPGLKAAMEKQIQEQADVVEKSKADGAIDQDAVKKLNTLKEGKAKLDGESGGNKFLGILELATDSIAQLKLYAQGGAK